MKRMRLPRVIARFACLVAVGLLLAITQSGCVAVGGYSSGGGWFFWPGGLGLVVVILLLLFFLRRGR